MNTKKNASTPATVASSTTVVTVDNKLQAMQGNKKLSFIEKQVKQAVDTERNAGLIQAYYLTESADVWHLSGAPTMKQWASDVFGIAENTLHKYKAVSKKFLNEYTETDNNGKSRHYIGTAFRDNSGNDFTVTQLIELQTVSIAGIRILLDNDIITLNTTKKLLREVAKRCKALPDGWEQIGIAAYIDYKPEDKAPDDKAPDDKKPADSIPETLQNVLDKLKADIKTACKKYGVEDIKQALEAVLETM